MKNDISKKTATKVLKLGNMNENSVIFTLTGIKIVPMNFLILGVHVSGAKFIIQTSFGRNYAARRAISQQNLAVIMSIYEYN